MKTDHFILLLAVLLLGGCTMVNPGYGWAPVPQEEFERTMLLNLWNKPAVPQRELRAQFQREQSAPKT